MRACPHGDGSIVRRDRLPFPSRGSAVTEKSPAARYRDNLQGEVDSVALYRALAEAEGDPQLAKIYGRLAAVEEAHAQFWRKRLAAIGARLPMLRAGFR